MKKFEKEIEIDATADDVWRALTDAEELKRWFPLDARVTPGVGGALWLSWGEGSDWETPIEVWEPSKHLRTVDTTPGKDGAPPPRVAVDYIIESRGGKTVLRIVHSGFAADMWDDEFDTLSSGWASFQANLKHYLERHRGQSRTLAFVRHPPVELPRPEVFRRTVAALGIESIDALRVGDRYSMTTRGGDRFAGVVKVLSQPINSPEPRKTGETPS